MSWRVIRLIAGRELRDLARDRRSVILLVVLPILLYPGFGLVGFLFALTLFDQQSVVGVVGLEALTRPVGGVAPLVVDGRFAPDYGDILSDPRLITLTPLAAEDPARLDRRELDMILVVPLDFAERLSSDASVTVEVRNREGDEISRLATRRVTDVFRKFAAEVKNARFARQGLPDDFDKPIEVREPKSGDTPLEKTWDELRETVAKMFPFMLVMWSLAGALHPAIDLCAGEKERGTMETLLISPAERTDVVGGKFLAVWTYSTVTAWWNLAWLAGLCLLGAWYFGTAFVSHINLLWCFLLVLPLSALFSALCLALGVYARSTKEGQYYLLPLFLGVVPLVLFALSPGAELTLGTSLIPVTGVCLLIQKVLGPMPGQAALYVLPALASLAACVALAVWWAERQFRREDVLFRESDDAPRRGWLAGFTAPTRTTGP
jgi:sodium transport system permease protein